MIVFMQKCWKNNILESKNLQTTKLRHLAHMVFKKDSTVITMHGTSILCFSCLKSALFRVKFASVANIGNLVCHKNAFNNLYKNQWFNQISTTKPMYAAGRGVFSGYWFTCFWQFNIFSSFIALLSPNCLYEGTILFA